MNLYMIFNGKFLFLYTRVKLSNKKNMWDELKMCYNDFFQHIRYAKAKSKLTNKSVVKKYKVGHCLFSIHINTHSHVFPYICKIFISTIYTGFGKYHSIER